MPHDVFEGVRAYEVFLLRHPTSTEGVCLSKLQHMHAATPQLTKQRVRFHSGLSTQLSRQRLSSPAAPPISMLSFLTMVVGLVIASATVGLVVDLLSTTLHRV